ncbi:DUF6455 family protein [Litoreibacter janthinus]|nr:DUF6455 family protein [Litoreibacter janthinus]
MTHRIHPMGDSRTHFWLTTGMARAVGVDLSAAIHQGLLTRSDYAEMVNECRKCEFADCRAWLDEQWDGPVEAPKACRNKNMWTWLARSDVQV